MDLSKAKTILIVAFLALNIFLGYRLWLSPQHLQAGQALSGEEADQVRELLLQAGFELTVAVPRQVPRLTLLHVERADADEINWGDVFFGQTVPGIIAEGGQVSFHKGDSRVTVSPSGQIIYRGSAIPPSPAGEETRQVVERFLQDSGIWREDLIFDYTLPRDAMGFVRHRFVQTYQGFPLFFSMVEAAVREGAINELQIYRVVPLRFSGEEIQAISALEAVLMFLEMEKDFPSQRIIDISLGYFSEDYDAERWEIVPVWRIAGALGHVVYINAFTGEAEAHSS